MRITVEYDTFDNMMLTTVLTDSNTIFADAEYSEYKEKSFQRIVDTMRKQGIHDYDIMLFKTTAHLQYNITGLV